MKTAGIIAEYNPFHNGHCYQLKQVREEAGADYIIIAMSGDFVQRGAPAILDKHTRAKAALLSGADMVCELPVTAACASAEYFAAAGVELLGKAGADVICYGCESKDEELMQAVTAALTEESDCFSHMVSAAVKRGCTYPQARQEALCEFLVTFDNEEIEEFLSSPNNILALEYEKAILNWNKTHSHKLLGHAILRIGEGYYSTDVHAKFISATAIRQTVFKSHAPFLLYPKLWSKVPVCSLASLVNARRRTQLADMDAFSGALYLKLLSLQAEGYEKFADCTPSLSAKIQNELWQYLGFRPFASLLKSKDITYTRICRVLFHILLDITKEDYADIKRGEGILYLRILGFSKNSSPLLSETAKTAPVPLVTKVADAVHILDAQAIKKFEKDLHAADLYRGIISVQCQEVLPNEYNTPLAIIP